MNRQLLCLIFSFIFIFFLSIKSVSAQTVVTGNLDIQYIFDENGESKVETLVDLTNITTAQYAQNFQLELSGYPPANISAHDSTGPIPVDVINQEKTTLIKLTFLHPVGGKGKSQQAVLVYDGPKAKQNDNTWEITLPAFSQPEFINSSTISISTPASFGIPILTSPEPEKAQTQKSGKRVVEFKNPPQANIVVHYGHFQTYEFSLSYNLDNPSNSAITSSIQLPADSFEHQVNYEQLSPEPVNIVATSNQSWQALYEIPAKHKLQIKSTGRVSSATDPTDFLKKYTPEVQITPVQYQLDPQEPPTVTWRRPWQYWPFISNRFELEIKNPNGKAIYHLPVSVAATGFLLQTPNASLDIDTLPPFGKTLISLNFSPSFLPPTDPRSVTVGLGSHTVTYNITDKYVSIWYLILVCGLTGLVIGLAIFAVKTGHIHLQKRRKNHHLHRQGQKSA